MAKYDQELVKKLYAAWDKDKHAKLSKELQAFWDALSWVDQREIRGDYDFEEDE